MIRYNFLCFLQTKKDYQKIKNYLKVFVKKKNIKKERNKEKKREIFLPKFTLNIFWKLWFIIHKRTIMIFPNESSLMTFQNKKKIRWKLAEKNGKKEKDGEEKKKKKLKRKKKRLFMWRPKTEKRIMATKKSHKSVFVNKVVPDLKVKFLTYFFGWCEACAQKKNWPTRNVVRKPKNIYGYVLQGYWCLFLSFCILRFFFGFISYFRNNLLSIWNVFYIVVTKNYVLLIAIKCWLF